MLFLGFDRGCYLDDAVFLNADDVSRAFHAVRPSQGVGVVSHAARRGSLVDVVFDVVDHVFWNDGGNASDGDGIWYFTCYGRDLAVVGACDCVIHCSSPFLHYTYAPTGVHHSFRAVSFHGKSVLQVTETRISG